MIITSDLVKALSAYVAKHKGAVIKQLFAATGAYSRLRTIFSDAKAGESVLITSAKLTEVLQGFQKGFQPKGDLNVDGNLVTQRRHKIDMLINPDEAADHWHGFLFDENVKREDMPLVKFILNIIFEKIAEDKEMEIIFKGIFVAPTEGVATTAGQTVDGLLKIIGNAVTDGKHTAFALGIFDLANTHEYVESMFDMVPDEHKFRPMDIWMSPEVQLAYARDKKSLYAWEQKMKELMQIDFSKINIVGTNGLAGTKFLGITPKGNFVKVKTPKNKKVNLEVQRFERDVKVLGDFYECYGVADFDQLYTNDQDLN